ncbi:MAG: hypothetical protein JNG89_11105 [Planctomycetaceae bacterium]|nr:hypothetical protein [Planctomycetaceae bacterium]
MLRADVPHWRSQWHPAFTILELVLALAVIATVIGLAWPYMLRFSGEQALKENVEAVRSRLARTRLSSMGSGLAYQFRYEPYGRQCIVLPAERPLDVSGSTTPAAGAVVQYPAQILELAEGMQFLSSPPGPAALTQQATAVERLSEDWLTQFGAPTTLAQVGWATAIRFQPDGTADDATLFIADADGRYQVITVRGLTATASVGPMERERDR